jgi:hypothetical protein
VAFVPPLAIDVIGSLLSDIVPEVISDAEWICPCEVLVSI